MCVCLSVYLSMFVWVWVCMYMSVCVCVCVCVCARACACVSVSVCMCVWLTMLAETKEHSLQNIRFTLIAMLYCLLMYIQQIYNNTWLLEQSIPWFLNTHTFVFLQNYIHSLIHCAYSSYVVIGYYGLIVVR